MELNWLDPGEPPEVDAIHRVVEAVMRRAGAVGWVEVPTRDETEQWLTGLTADVESGHSRVAVVSAGGRVEGIGRWTWYAKPAVAVNAEIEQVMVHPAARGRGLARRLVAALVDDARGQGVETLTLDTRGNNHAAMALYETLGFEVCGRLPDFVAVGRDRWDRVLYRLDLRSADTPVRRHGARPVGPGASGVRVTESLSAVPSQSLSGPTDAA